jgi:hypothetical protein
VHIFLDLQNYYQKKIKEVKEVQEVQEVQEVRKINLNKQKIDENNYFLSKK